MRIKNAEIQGFVEFLMGLQLNGKQSRMRTRLCKLLGDQIRQMDEERMELIKINGEVGEDGNPVTIRDEETGSMVYKINNQEQFRKDYEQLLSEDFIMDETEERMAMLLEVKDIVFNVDGVFSGDEALVYDRWCEIVEGIGE